jgi:hypothetical protein
VDSQKYRAKLKREGVETMGDECSPVGWILSPFGARRNYWTFLFTCFIPKMNVHGGDRICGKNIF